MLAFNSSKPLLTNLRHACTVQSLFDNRFIRALWHNTVATIVEAIEKLSVRTYSEPVSSHYPIIHGLPCKNNR